MKLKINLPNKFKYQVNKDFRKLYLVNAPMFEAFLPLNNAFIEIFPKGINKSKVNFETFYIESSFDKAKIKIYLISPKDLTDEKTKALVYYHGGGFMYKGAFNHYILCEEYALRAHMKVFYVDYRLAPANKYPICLLDSIDAYDYIMANKEKYNLNDEIFVGGDSAGGNLAIGVTQSKCEINKDIPKKQMLIYPVVDKDLETVSKNIFVDTPVWNSRKNEKMWEMYLGDKEYKSLLKDTYDNIPPTYVEVCEFDPLRDEGVYYGAKVKAIINQTKETIHGYDACMKSKITQENLERRISFFNSK